MSQPLDALKTLLLLISVGLVGCATTPSIQAVCQIQEIGAITELPADRIFGVSDLEPSQPLSTFRGAMKFAENTSIITAKLGTAFGVRHHFQGVPRHKRIEVYMTHPEINYPNNPTTISRWTKNPTDQGTSFTFDLPEEMVQGEWTFIFSFEGSELCRQSFDVEV